MLSSIIILVQYVVSSVFSTSPPSVLDPHFCEDHFNQPLTSLSLNTTDMSCKGVLEFIYISKQLALENMKNHSQDFEDYVIQFQNNYVSDPLLSFRPRFALEMVSAVSSLAMAHLHLIAVLTLQRGECFSENIRLILLVEKCGLRGAPPG